MSNNGAQEQRDAGVLGALPRTRPQRASPRRSSAKRSGEAANARKATPSKTGTGKARDGKAEAAGTGAAKAASGETTPAKTASAKAAPAKAAPAKAAAKRRAGSTNSKPAPPRRREPPAPRQGYEPLEEPKQGASVSPPSGVELVESIASIFAELASASLQAAGRVLKDALSPFRRP